MAGVIDDIWTLVQLGMFSKGFGFEDLLAKSSDLARESEPQDIVVDRYLTVR